MINIPDATDLKELQKQFSAIYEYLKVHPVPVCRTTGMGYTLMINTDPDNDLYAIRELEKRWGE